MRSSGVLRGKLSAGKAAGISCIVDDPHTHVALLRLCDKLAEKGEVLRRQVREWHAVSGLHGDRLKAQAMHRVQIALDLFSADVSVQAVIRLGPVLGGRSFPCRSHLRRGGGLHNLPELWRLSSCCLRQQ